jgi:cellulose synthase/poly-beta-1,6-N-acetylglucosamine synthase-like glycosyltransferase
MNRTTNKNKSRVLLADNEASANDNKCIRNILIFDNHPASLRLLREVYLAPPQPTLPEYILVSALLIAVLLLGMFCIA